MDNVQNCNNYSTPCLVPDSVRYDVHEIMAVCPEFETEPMNTLWRSHTDLLNVEEIDDCCYICAIKWLKIVNATCALKSLIYESVWKRWNYYFVTKKM
jgi:hypothetical protein